MGRDLKKRLIQKLVTFLISELSDELFVDRVKTELEVVTLDKFLVHGVLDVLLFQHGKLQRFIFILYHF